MSRLSEKIAVASDIDDEPVFIPKWDVTLNVRGMDGNGRAEYLKKIVRARESEDDTELAQIEAEVLIQCLFDPDDGTRVFEDEDIPMLLTKHGGVIGMLSRKALVASGLDADAEERLGKPSSASTTLALVPEASTQNDASTSTSPTVLE